MGFEEAKVKKVASKFKDEHEAIYALLGEMIQMPKVQEEVKDEKTRDESLSEEVIALEAIFGNDFARPNSNTINIRFEPGFK